MIRTFTYRLTTLIALAAALMTLHVSRCAAQKRAPQISAIQPDAATRGMSFALEILAPASDTGSFGADGIGPGGLSIELLNPRLDSSKVVFGVPVVSWRGRVIQVPVFVPSKSSLGNVPFRIRRGDSVSRYDTLRLMNPGPSIQLQGGGMIGDESTAGKLSPGNTLVVESMTLSVLPGDQGYYVFRSDSASNLQPVYIMSVGPVRLINAPIRAGGDSVAGGPGGGGGGHGFSGIGGRGYTGGGNCSNSQNENIGSGGLSTDSTGGPSVTGVVGGKSDKQDQGGGGGTGAPYGSSGESGTQNAASPAGGFGGGSAGGEEFGGTLAYGGGGGGFTTEGAAGEGVGDNGGKQNGGRVLLPMQGGSGGGAGNALADTRGAGSGGGGGGAVTIYSLDSVIVRASRLIVAGASGTSGADNTAGGGGGSGGALSLVSETEVKLQGTSFEIGGGSGGAGGMNGARGGNGGNGYIQIAGSRQPLTGNLEQAPSITIEKPVVSGDLLTVTGYLIDPINALDSVRIYFRDRATGWRFVSALVTTGSPLRNFSASLPKSYAAEAYVAAAVKIKSPLNRPANFEPEWLYGHASIRVVALTPSPRLRAVDSLEFHCIKAGQCANVYLLLHNDGEAPLIISSATLRIGARFSLLTPLPISIRGFDTASLLIQYCAALPGAPLPEIDRDTLRIESNDTVKLVRLVGCALERDELLRFRPKLLRARTDLSTCDTLRTTVYSEGEDKVSLSTIATRPNFRLLTVLPDSLMSGDSLQIAFEFCPDDTTTRRDSLIVRDDTLRMLGTGLLRELTSNQLSFNTCKGDCFDFADTLRNIGNDTVLISGSAANLSTARSALPIAIPPHDSVIFHWRICSDSTVSDTLRYEGTLSKPAVSTLSLVTHVISVTVDIDSIGILCVGGVDTINIHLSTAGEALFARVTAGGVGPFSWNAESDTLGSQSYRIAFKPAISGSFVDTFVVVLRSNYCERILRIPIHATATSSPILFAESASDTVVVGFEDIVVGGCSADTVTMVNPCGFDEEIKADLFRPPFSSSFLPTQLAAGSQIRIPLVFCPTALGDFTDTVRFRSASGKMFVAILRGAALGDVGKAFATIIMESGVVAVGESRKLQLAIVDTGGGAEIIYLRGSLLFDPRVAVPTGISPTAEAGPKGWSVIGDEAVPGVLRFTAQGLSYAGPLLTVDWRGLLAAKDTTAIIIVIDSVAGRTNLKLRDGLLIVLACDTLGRSITFAAPYVLGLPYPNPASGRVHVPFVAGANGRLWYSAVSAAGNILLRGSKVVVKGSQLLEVDLSLLPAGGYILEFESNGWREFRRVVVP